MNRRVERPHVAVFTQSLEAERDSWRSRFLLDPTACFSA
jgi:hypothetical protein